MLRRLKAGGYKVVQMKAKEQLETLPEYDAMLVKDLKLPAVERASGRERGADGAISLTATRQRSLKRKRAFRLAPGARFAFAAYQ